MKKNKFNIIVLIIYSVCVLGIIRFHEAWRDEAQSWLIARDLTLPEIFSQMKYEGHFLLWYIILIPFAKLGFPYFSQRIICCFFCIAAAGLIAFKSPFSKFKKILIIFGTAMLYLYPVISRCYCIIPLAISLISIFYKERYKKSKTYVLCIILLANTHVIMLGMVGYLVLDFVYGYYKNKKNIVDKEKNNIKTSMILLILLLILSGIPLLTSLTSNKDVGNSFSLGYNIISTIFMQPLILIQNNFYNFFDNTVVLTIVLMALSFYIYYELKYNKLEFLKIYCIFFWIFIIGGFIYGISSQRAVSAIFILIFFLWNRENKKNILKIDKCFRDVSIIVLMSLSVANGMIDIYKDIKYQYSSAKETANYINQNINENAILLTGNQPEFCSSIIPYTENRKFYYIQREDYFSFVTLDEISRKDLSLEQFEKIRRKFQNKDLYYVYEPYKATKSSDKEIIMLLEKDNNIEKVYESSKSIVREDYIIYKVK